MSLSDDPLLKFNILGMTESGLQTTGPCKIPTNFSCLGALVNMELGHVRSADHMRKYRTQKTVKRHVFRQTTRFLRVLVDSSINIEQQ